MFFASIVPPRQPAGPEFWAPSMPPSLESAAFRFTSNGEFWSADAILPDAHLPPRMESTVSLANGTLTVTLA